MKNISIRELILSGLFLATSSIVVMFQIYIPPYLALEFSLLIILIARRYVGILMTLIISTIYPWASFVAPAINPLIAAADPIGISILVVATWTTLIMDFIFVRHSSIKSSILGAIISTMVASLIMTILNILVFTPAYLGFRNWDKFWTWDFIKTYFTIIFPFNILKVGVNYILFLPLYYKLKKII